MKKIVMAALLSAVAAGSAVAADTRFYAGARLGYSIIDKSSLASGVFGGYMIGPDFAVEIGYTDLGSVAGVAGGTVGTVEFSTLELDAVATFPVNDQFSLFGKLGMANTTETGLGRTGTRLAATYGMGGQYNINPIFGVRLTWDHYSFGDSILWKPGYSNLYTVAGLVKF